eukprot:gene13568-18208_t
MIKVITKSGGIVEGELFAIDPVTHFVVLVTKDNGLEQQQSSSTSGSGSFTIINPESIESMYGNMLELKVPDVSLFPNSGSLEKKEAVALKQAEKSVASMNSSVSAVVQSLFDMMSSYYPCVWSGNNIIVLNEYIIAPPYTIIVVMEDGQGKDKERVTGIFERTKKKLNL